MPCKEKVSPCVSCKRKPNCPVPCYPKKDWERGNLKRRGRCNGGRKIGR